MNYLQLFSLSLQHDYYSDQRCGDFLIEATPETQKLLANFRCVLKPLPNGIRVLIQVNDQGMPFIALPASSSFAFRLRSQNADFSLFTDLGTVANLAVPLYTNSTSSTTSASSGVLNLVADDQAPRLAAGIFANVRLTLDNPGVPLAENSHAFVLQWQAKKFRWKYYVITNPGQSSNDQPAQPAIVDKDKAIVFDAANMTDLTRFPDPLDPIGAQLARQYPGLQLFRLLSNSLIPCQQAVRKSIQLLMSGEKVLNALPSPVIQNFVIDAKNGTKEDGLYQVVNYFTR